MSRNIQDKRFELMEEIVSLYDKDKSGLINVRDSSKILKTLGRQLTEEEIEQFISLIDPEEEGKVTISAFMQGITTVFTVPQEFLEEVKDAFNFFDTNNDGIISSDEFKKILMKFGGYEKKYLEGIFKQLDLDKDGEININEFIEAWKFQ